MSRTFTHQALVLQVRSSGESNREAVFLSAEEGILRATVFGGPKSKLRAYVAPFHAGTLWIYRDPVRDYRKVSDFDVQSWKPGLRESYMRLMTAGALAETVLTGHGGGGSWKEALHLAEDSLCALELASDQSIPGLLYRFLWLWAEILGVLPETQSCSHCACRYRDDEVVWYSRLEGCLRCTACSQALLRQDEQNLIRMDPGARRWLHKSTGCGAMEASRISLDKTALNQVRLISTELVSGALGRRLNCWDACIR